MIIAPEAISLLPLWNWAHKFWTSLFVNLLLDFYVICKRKLFLFCKHQVSTQKNYLGGLSEEVFHHKFGCVHHRHNTSKEWVTWDFVEMQFWDYSEKPLRDQLLEDCPVQKPGLYLIWMLECIKTLYFLGINH